MCNINRSISENYNIYNTFFHKKYLDSEKEIDIINRK